MRLSALAAGRSSSHRRCDRRRGRGREPLHRPGSRAPALPQPEDRPAERPLRPARAAAGCCCGRPATSQSRGRGPMELHGKRNGRHSMRVNQRIYRGGGGHIDLRTRRRTCTSPTSAPTSAAPTGRSTSSPASSCGGRPDGELAPGPRRPEARTTACATSSAPDPGPRSPRHRHYPGCNQNPTAGPVTLGTSVGWSDIYPSDYDKQWINVAGLRGCFAFVMRVDPQTSSTSPTSTTTPPAACVHLPFRGDGLLTARRAERSLA